MWGVQSLICVIADVAQAVDTCQCKCVLPVRGFGGCDGLNCDNYNQAWEGRLNTSKVNEEN